MNGKIATILLSAILFRLFYISGTLANYAVNYSGFLEKCENRDKPQMQCNGQCILMKSLKEAEPSEDQSPAEGREINHQIGMYYLLTELPIHFKRPDHVHVKSVYTEKLDPLNTLIDIFHPPKHFS